MCSEGVRRLLRAAISDNTRRSYATAVRRYQLWRAGSDRCMEPRSLTTPIALEFLTDLCESTELTHKTICAYVASLSNWWSEALLPGSNPLQHPHITRLLTGVQRTRLPAKIAADLRARETRPTDVTVELLEEMRPHILSGGTLAGRMRFAAATLATYGLLRPGELLGSAQQRDRALRRDQLQFFIQSRRVGLEPGALPDHLQINLGVTKADAVAANAPVVIAAPSAVRVIWEWARQHATWGMQAHHPLFCLPGSRPLAVTELIESLEHAAGELAGHAVTIRGKSFRRGGASSLVASGAPLTDIQAAGRWRSAAMPDLYSSAASKLKRAIVMSRRMEPPFAASAADPSPRSSTPAAAAASRS